MIFSAQIKNSSFLKTILIIAFFVISALIWGIMWIYGHYYVSTDNAYVNANVVHITPRITGKINNLYVTNNEYVKQGQPLFEIDPEPFQLAVDSAKAQVEICEAKLAQAKLTAKRTLTLVKTKYASPQEGDNILTTCKTAAAELQHAKASLTQAMLNLNYTKVIAPTSGWVSNVSTRAGDIVPAYQPMFALISDEEFWVDANFKETEIESIKPGQPVTITTDVYPKHPFKGTVESISGGAGTAFSLLPPQNATGNWVKVTQRIPVRIRVLNPDPAHQLRIGISTNVTIHLNNNLQKG